MIENTPSVGSHSFDPLTYSYFQSRMAAYIINISKIYQVLESPVVKC